VERYKLGRVCFLKASILCLYSNNQTNSPNSQNSPIVFFTPGEVAAAGYTGYITNRTITGLFAQEIKGAAVMLEHRYYGSSSPYDTLTVENLQLLNVEQAIEDGINFAKNVEFPFDTDHSSNADKAPWVFSGGSYSGALSAYTASVHPNVFWAYHSSSAPVEAIHDYVSLHSCHSIEEFYLIQTVAIFCTGSARNAKEL